MFYVMMMLKTFTMLFHLTYLCYMSNFNDAAEFVWHNVLTGVNQAAVDEVESQIFAYNVKLTNESGYSLLTWKEVIDQNSTKCNTFSDNYFHL